jgi:hypothetical protein
LDVFKLYDSLIKLKEHTRKNFDDFETEALAKAVNKDYKINTTRKKKERFFTTNLNLKNRFIGTRQF